MDQNERRPENKVTIDKDAQINVVVNHTGEEDATIDLGRVFHNMKVKRRIYAWVLVLCLVVGICAPLLIYQFNKPMLTVSSVVTLKYEVPMVKDAEGSLIPLAQYEGTDEPEITWVTVSDLTAPDGSALDLSPVTSSSILQAALNKVALSQPVSLSALQNNITIERVMTDESRQVQELASKMTDDKNSEAYSQIQELEIRYAPKFVVRLVNGFGDKDAKVKTVLSDDELRNLLDQILAAYNNYLVDTYANKKMPDNEISEIRIESLDLLESLESLQTASDNLYDYCDSQRDSVKAYRSYRDGRNLEDWMQTIKTGREVSIDYLYSYVYTSSLIRNREEMRTLYANKKRDADQSLQDVKSKIEADMTTKDKNYKKPTVIVSMQESGTIKSTQVTPDFYNDLVLRLAKNYDKLVELEITSDDLNRKITALKDTEAIKASEEEVDQAYEELVKTKAACETVYNGIVAQMAEITESAFFNNYAEHTVPQGKLQNFLLANLKNMIVGAAVGAVLACGLWFLAALAPEFRRNRKDDEDEKKPDRKGIADGKEAAEA